MESLPPSKQCSKCGILKSIDQFTLRESSRDGRASACKECKNEQQRAYRRPFRICKDCRQRKPVEEFTTQRICNDCKAHKTCKVCGERLELSAFDGFHGLVCRPCQKRLNAERYTKNRERFRERNAAWRKANAQPGSEYRERQKVSNQLRKQTIKAIVYEHYGGFICACCGETEPIFLTIDHINNDGNKHRRETNNADSVRWLYQNGMPEGFRVLCYNCNAGRARNGGICPHQQQREHAV